MDINAEAHTSQDSPWANAQAAERRKKCHGNRKSQSFRKKCRARGMKPDTIEKRLQKRLRQHSKHKQVNEPVATGAATTTTISKRKRDVSSLSLQQPARASSILPPSTSSLSMRQPPLKRTRQKTSATTRLPVPTSHRNNDRSVSVLTAMLIV
jgi:hypothetical protein